MHPGYTDGCELIASVPYYKENEEGIKMKKRVGYKECRYKIVLQIVRAVNMNQDFGIKHCYRYSNIRGK